MNHIRQDAIRSVPFADLDVEDPFFTSLRNDYNPGFDEWFARKATQGEHAHMVLDVDGAPMAMLYLKEESDRDDGITPTLTKRRLKIGTFKVDFDHHTSIGKRLLALALRRFATSGCEYVYLTVFDNPRTMTLRNLLGQYGFTKIGIKRDGDREEEVWAKRRPTSRTLTMDARKTFPFMSMKSGSTYLLAIRPEHHAKMFGEVNLRSEIATPVPDSIPINTIEKIYLSAAWNAERLRPGDRVLIYRMSDIPGKAHYRSVVTSVCTVTDTRPMDSFPDKAGFLAFIKGRSVFSDAELDSFWWKRKYPWIISMVFNFPLHRYPNRKALIEHGMITEKQRLVCEPIKSETFERIIGMGGVDEGYVVD